MNLRLKQYYAATIMFIALDFWAGFNVRIAFLDNSLSLRLAYYGFCAICFGLMLWRPLLAPVIAGFESLLALVALILSTGAQVLSISDEVIDTGSSAISLETLINFLIVGFVSYFVWQRGMREMFEKSR